PLRGLLPLHPKRLRYEYAGYSSAKKESDASPPKEDRDEGIHRCNDRGAHRIWADRGRAVVRRGRCGTLVVYGSERPAEVGQAREGLYGLRLGEGAIADRHSRCERAKGRSPPAAVQLQALAPQDRRQRAHDPGEL